MNKTLLTAFLLLSCAHAGAADWSGLYVGGNFTYDIGKAETNITGRQGFTSGVAGSTAASLAMPNSLAPKIQSRMGGGLIGGQIGYGWQSGNWVYGLEGDLQAGRINGAGNGDGVSTVAGFSTNTLRTNVRQDDTIKFMTTLRGRLGYSLGNVLLYGTAGLAYAELRSTVSTNFAFDNIAPGTFQVSQSNSNFNSSRIGAAVGGGVEYAFDGKWFLKAEYLYYDLGKTSNTYGVNITANTGFFAAAGYTHNTRWTGNLIRIGLNYRF